MSVHIAPNDRTRTYWTPAMERFFIDLMLEHMHRGNRIGHTFKKQAWNEMLSVFNAKFGSQYDKDVLKSRYTNLWKQYNSVKNLLGYGGFSWDENQQMVIGDENVWSLYIKAHPEARVYKTKAVLNFNDLCLIYGYTVADGRYSRSSHDLDFDDEFQGVNMGESGGGFVPATNDCPRTDWTPAMDQHFIELMLDQIGRGEKTGDAFSKQAWTEMLALFNARFGAQYGKRVLRHRHNKLLKYYKDMKAILSEDGFSWDETLQMISAEDDIWDSYIKKHPHARMYRMRTLPNYNDLDIIFGNPVDQGIFPHMFQSKDLKEDSSAAKTGERKASQTDNSDRTRTFWTPPMDHYLIDLLVGQVHKGNKVGQTFITSSWIEMVTVFNAKFGSHHNKEVLKNRFKHLRRLYNDITFLLEQNGFMWDARRDMVVAEDSIWDSYIQAHPEARSYRVKMVPNYQKLCVIFGKEIPDGRYTRLAQAFEPDDLVEAATMTGDGKNDYLCGSIDSPCTVWTPVMDRCLVDLMLEQVNRGNKIGETFTEQAWADMVESFNAKFGLQSDIYILENRFIYLMKERDDISHILNHSEFAWDEDKQTIVADDDESWEAYIKEHPDATIYRGKLLENYSDLCKISGPFSQESFNCENLMIEMENFTHDIDIDDANLSHDRHRKRTNSTAFSPLGHPQKAQKTGRETGKLVSEAEGDVAELTDQSGNLSSIGNAIDALQALPDLDDELLLDACDLLEDERKAKTFLALDVSLRKKWLLRKLRPLSNF